MHFAAFVHNNEWEILFGCVENDRDVVAVVSNEFFFRVQFVGILVERVSGFSSFDKSLVRIDFL